jgi:hypothetical protein
MWTAGTIEGNLGFKDFKAWIFVHAKHSSFHNLLWIKIQFPETEGIEMKIARWMCEICKKFQQMHKTNVRRNRVDLYCD